MARKKKKIRKILRSPCAMEDDLDSLSGGLNHLEGPVHALMRLDALESSVKQARPDLQKIENALAPCDHLTNTVVSNEKSLNQMRDDLSGILQRLNRAEQKIDCQIDCQYNCHHKWKTLCDGELYILHREEEGGRKLGIVVCEKCGFEKVIYETTVQTQPAIGKDVNFWVGLSEDDNPPKDWSEKLEEKGKTSNDND